MENKGLEVVVDVDDEQKSKEVKRRQCRVREGACVYWRKGRSS